MGCHTWAYKKISALTKEEKEKIIDAFIEKTTNWWGFKETSESLTETFEELFKKDPYRYNSLGMTPAEYAEDIFKKFTERLKIAKSRDFEKILKYFQDDIVEIIEVENELYKEIDCDYPFRLSWYTKETFQDKESLLEFLKLHEEEVSYWDEDKLKPIFGYTSELVKRIDDYFKLHGEDNLYFEFG